MGPQDHAALTLLSGYNKGLTCLLCAQCVSSCPEHIGIADIFRYERYARDYHELDRARREYAALTRNGTSCVGCGDCLPTCSQEIDIGTDLSKRILRKLDFTLHTRWAQSHPVGAPATTRWGGLDSGLQYQLFVNDDRESMGLVGLNVSWAGGLRNVTTLTPTFDFGKGLGELPESLKFLRPLAVTSNLSFDFPTQTESAGAPNPNNFNYGFAFEYSLPYLQCCVKDVGLRHPFSQMIPLVEVAFSTPVNRNAGLKTTGTIQPGVIWSGRYYQIGAEAVVPTNGATGHGLGAIVQLHWYLDDLFPHSIGQPILGRKS